MDLCKDKILTIIRQTSLSAEETSLWQNMLNVLPDSFCNDILSYMESYPDAVKILTESLKEKSSAVKNADMKKWAEIIEKEKENIKYTKK